MNFLYCPRCNSGRLEYDNIKVYHCPDCDYTYYHNPAAAAAGIIFFKEKLILLKRAKEPGKGKLDLPGGFVDPGETAEEAIKREILEELGVQATWLKYFASFPNMYEYKGILYSTCDLIFEVTINTFPEKPDKTEVEEILLVSPGSVHTLEFAFDSIKKAVISNCEYHHLV